MLENRKKDVRKDLVLRRVRFHASQITVSCGYQMNRIAIFLEQVRNNPVNCTYMTIGPPQVNFNKSKYRVQSLTSMSPELCLTTKLHSLDLGTRYIQPNDCDLCVRFEYFIGIRMGQS